MATADLTAARLRELLDYDAATGAFTWRAREWAMPRGGIKSIAGQPAGRRGVVYWFVEIERRRYRAHRLAWLWMTGDWPDNVIDHRDGNGFNNAFENLRDVSQAVNTQNLRKAGKTTASRLLGVYRSNSVSERWDAKIKRGGKSIFLGAYDTPEAAHQAYVEAKRKLHEGCTI